MASYRDCCLLASPSPDRIIIVGGCDAGDSVEEFAVHHNKKNSCVNEFHIL